MFDGETFEPEKDRSRLTAQLSRVERLVSDGVWRTLAQIGKETGDPESSVSARLRDLRKAKFGGNTVNRRRVANTSGLYEYQFVKRASEEKET